MIILDTNVVSELMKPQPAQRVLRWISAHPPRSVFTTSVTRAEILYGIRLLPAGKRRDALERAADVAFERGLAGRILSFTEEAAPPYADISATRRRAGLPIASLDAQIAAIARLHRATLATRNLADFRDCGVELADPWQP